MGIVKLVGFTDDATSDGWSGSLNTNDPSPKPTVFPGEWSESNRVAGSVILPSAQAKVAVQIDIFESVDLVLRDAALNELVRVEFQSDNTIDVDVSGVEVANGITTPNWTNGVWNRFWWLEYDGTNVKLSHSNVAVVTTPAVLAAINEVRVEPNGFSGFANLIIIDPDTPGVTGPGDFQAVDLFTVAASGASSGDWVATGGAANLGAAIATTNGQTAQATTVGAVLDLSFPPISGSVAAFIDNEVTVRHRSSASGTDAGTQLRLGITTNGSTTYSPAVTTPADGRVDLTINVDGEGNALTPASFDASDLFIETVA